MQKSRFPVVVAAIQIVSVGIVSYLFFQDGQQRMEFLAQDLCGKLSDRINQNWQRGFVNLSENHQSTITTVQFLRVLPMRDDEDVDWLMVAALSEVNLREHSDAKYRNTGVLCFLVLVMAAIASRFTPRWLPQSVPVLERAGSASSERQLKPDLTVRRESKLEAWKQCIEQTAHQLQHSLSTFNPLGWLNITRFQRAEQRWANYCRDLELKVRHQAAELAQVKEQLQQEKLQREQTELALQNSQEKLRLITDSVPAGIAYVDADRRYRFINRMYEQRFNRPRESMLGHYVWEVIGQDAYDRVKDTIDQVLQGEQRSLEFGITYETGETRYISTMLSPDFGPGNTVMGYSLVFFDITDRKCLEDSLKKVNDELERLVTFDDLTQIANRRKFDEYLDQEWKRLIRTQSMLSLILFDADFFKSYNDLYGHQAGDTCLLEIAQAAKKAVKRPADLVARYGGEEFAVILPNTDQQGAIAIAEQVRQAVQALAIPHARSQVAEMVTISLGIASLVPTPSASVADLIHLADTALYTAKQQGRNQLSIH